MTTNSATTSPGDDGSGGDTWMDTSALDEALKSDPRLYRAYTIGKLEAYATCEALFATLRKERDGYRAELEAAIKAGTITVTMRWHGVAVAALRTIAALRHSETGEPFDDALDLADAALAALPPTPTTQGTTT